MAGRVAKLRNDKGSFSVVAFSFMGILMMLGLLSFDVIAARQQYNQLKSATDASALAAAKYLRVATEPDLELAKQIALTYFRKNRLISASLEGARYATSALQDSPATGESEFNLAINPADNSVRAESAFGLQPSLLSFIGTFPIHAVSSAGPGQRITGDVAFVVDLSGSMSFATSRENTANISRQYHAETKDKPAYVSYQVRHRGGTNPELGKGPGGPNRGPNAAAMPDPSKIAFSPNPAVGGYEATEPAVTEATSAPKLAIDAAGTPLLFQALNKFAQLSPKPTNPATGSKYTIDDAKVALLVEAKRGNLDSDAQYHSSRADKSITKYIGGFTPEVGYQAEYQRLALCVAQPLASEVQAVHYFMDKAAATDVHWSFVGFGNGAPGVGNREASVLDKTQVGSYQFPLIELQKDKQNHREVLDSLDLGTMSWGTHTYRGLTQGMQQLTGPGHTDGWKKTLILLTDGVPTQGDAFSVVRQFPQKGIRLITIGFFEGDYAYPRGPAFVKKLTVKAGNGALSYTVGSRDTQLPASEQVLAADRKIIEEILVKASAGEVTLR